VIYTIVIIGKNIGQEIFITRMNLVPLDSGLPFKFKEFNSQYHYVFQ